MGIDWETLLGVKKDEKKKQPEQVAGEKPASAPTPAITQQSPTPSTTQTVAQLPPPQPAPQPPQKAEVATTPVITKDVLKPVVETKITEEDLLAEEPAQPAKEVWLIFGDKGCLIGDTKIVTINGEKPIYEIYKNGKPEIVLSLDMSLKPVYKLAIPIYTGKQEVYEVITTHGSIVATLEQTFYTLDGPKTLKELKIGDRIIYIETSDKVSGPWKAINTREGARTEREDTEGEAWQALERWFANKRGTYMSNVWKEIHSTKTTEVLLKELPSKILHENKQPNEKSRIEEKTVGGIETIGEVQTIKATTKNKSNKENESMVEEITRDRTKLYDLYDARRVAKILSKDKRTWRMAETLLHGTPREASEQFDEAKLQKQVGALNGWFTVENGSELQVVTSSKVGDWSEVCGFSGEEQVGYRGGWSSLSYAGNGYTKRHVIVEGGLQYIAILSRGGNEERIAEEASKALNTKGSFRIKAGLADVLEIRRVGVLDTYDLHVLDTHTYIANGFITHNTGKTTVALSFPGEILVLSFDRKSAIIKHNMYNNDPRIHVFDVVKLMDYSSPEKMVESADKTFEYINALLDTYTKKYPQPDWVVIDGAQIFQQICEWTMRYRHNLGPFDGIANLNLWKERRMYIRQIHNKALNLAKRGIIYTTYVEKDEVIIKGEVVTRKDTPAWIDVLIYETDYVLYTSYDESKKTYHVRVVSSKNDKRVKSGAEFDVTNRRFSDYVSWS